MNGKLCGWGFKKLLDIIEILKNTVFKSYSSYQLLFPVNFQGYLHPLIAVSVYVSLYILVATSKTMLFIKRVSILMVSKKKFKDITELIKPQMQIIKFSPI